MAEKRKAETQIESASPKIIRTEVGKYFTAQPFRDLLVRSSVESLAYKKEKGVVFFVDRTDKVSDVFKGLVKHNFLSVPVLQKTKHKWYGFIEAGDIVQFYVDHFGDQLGDEGQKVWDVIAKREGFMDKTVGDVMKHPLSRKNPFHPITVGYSLYYALETLAREENLHRVPIIDSERNLKSVLSLSQVIEFIHENINMLGSIKDKPLKDVHGVLKPVVTVNENERAIDAFKVMQTKSIGGVAVVNDEGKVTGNLSERDLKAVRLEHQLFHRLFQKVHNFIRHLREEFQQDDHRPKTKQVLHIDDTLEHAIAVLMSNGIHRSYIVDADHKPIGVVSLKDILLEIINN